MATNRTYVYVYKKKEREIKKEKKKNEREKITHNRLDIFLRILRFLTLIKWNILNKNQIIVHQLK